MNRSIACVAIQRAWARRQARVLARIRREMYETCTCVICNDETSSIVYCINGHAVCTGCDACMVGSKCPVCRDVRATSPDRTISTVSRLMGLRMRCSLCRTCVPVEGCEFHRAWCPQYRFTCPVDDCTFTETASNLLAHVQTRHPSVCFSSSLDPDDDGVSFTFLVTHVASDVVVVVDDTVVTISFSHRSYAHAVDMHNGTSVLYMSAYYESPRRRAISATVYQQRVADVRTHTWTEACHMGVVPPVVASRERAVAHSCTPHIVPRCVVVSEDDTLDHRLSLLLRPHRILRDIEDYGIRDRPIATRPRVYRDPGIPVSIVNIVFRRESHAIGDLYNS